MLTYMGDRKILVLDTSVLLYDKCAIHSFPGNDVIIPLIVLDELDRFKERPGILGESARYVNRYLDNLRSMGRLDQGVILDDIDQSIKVESRNSKLALIPDDLDSDCGDNKILGVALLVQSENKDRLVKVITKDINFRVKCDAVQLLAEDYYKDYINLDNNEHFTGSAYIKVGDDKIDEFYEDNFLPYESEDLCPNQFIVATSNTSKKSALGIYRDKAIRKIPGTHLNNSVGIEAKNKEQGFAMHLLSDPGIQLVTITGLAGSGKTFLTIMCGLSSLFNEEYNRIIITRSIQPVGRDLGYLPGDVDEKMDPWLAPIVDNIKQAFSDTTYFSCLRDKGQVEIAPLSYIRGRTFNDSYIIVDEAQNTTIHELKTIITRTGKGSKIILLGDTDQVDTPYIDKRSNGLSIVLEKFKNSDIAGHIHLPVGQRSEIATIASKIL
tara:strand:- start:1801 stop:3114 length:1314 start_codon:yes stop_codon:yes gene_type:complete